MLSVLDRMIILYYKNNIEGLNGQTVLLKFSRSNQFLKCADKNGKAVITLEVRLKLLVSMFASHFCVWGFRDFFWVLWFPSPN